MKPGAARSGTGWGSLLLLAFEGVEAYEAGAGEDEHRRIGQGFVGALVAASIVYGFSQAYQLSFDSDGVLDLVTVAVGLLQAGTPVVYGLAAGALVLWLDKGLRSLLPVLTGLK